jgi:hypothetical protein
VVLPPPPQSQAPYPPQAQGYVPPATSTSYGQQAPGTPGQVGGPPQPPTTDKDNRNRINLIIGLIVLVLILLGGVLGLYIFASQRNNTPATTPTPGVTPTATPTSTPTPTPTPGKTPTPTPTSVPFQVTTIDMSVNPLTISGMPCGTQLTVTYTATFNVLAKGPGGAVQFTYTTDGGKTTKTGLEQFNAGQTSKQFQFTSSGMLALNGAFPGSGQVTTTSPNVVSSQTAIPSGTCTPSPTSTP